MMAILVAWLLTGVLVYQTGRWMWRTHCELDAGHYNGAQQNYQWFLIWTGVLVAWVVTQLTDQQLRAMPEARLHLEITILFLVLAGSALLTATDRLRNGH